MAITVTTDQCSGSGFALNANSADLSGCEELNAAPATGVSHYLSSVMISSNATLSVTIGAGETAGAVTTVLYGPIYMLANTTHTWVFREPLKVGDATALVVDASGSGNVTLFVEGTTQ